MGDRIIGVFPSLVDQTIARLPVILHEAVAVAVSVVVDPAKRRFDMRPEIFYESPVAGPFIVRTSQQNEQRRRVDAAIVTAEWHFLAQPSRRCGSHVST